MGLVDCEGSILWKGQNIQGKKPFEVAHLGLGYVPENRDIFPKLTVRQNLLLGQKGNGKGSRWSFDDMYAMFPRLKEREHTEAGVISGGENRGPPYRRMLEKEKEKGQKQFLIVPGIEWLEQRN
jgi:branched-chain amino acid transport system ATP-binding protein